MKALFVAVLAVVISSSLWMDVKAQNTPAPSDLRFTETAVYRVDATSLELLNRDATPKAYPQVGHLLLTGFDMALKSWANNRFQLTGNSANHLRITMREGRITETILPITKGVAGWFKKEESLKYEAALDVEIAIVDPNGVVLTKTDTSVTASQTLIEGADVPEREATWMQLVNTCFNNLDRELKSQLPQNLAQYIR
jgi:hypothetical protein